MGAAARGNRMGIRMWSSISINIKPTWNIAEYRVVAHWLDEVGVPPVVLTREGIIDVGIDDGPEVILKTLAAVLREPWA